MGNSCLLQARETPYPVKFIPPPFANKYTKENLNGRLNLSSAKSWISDNFWWIEMGGTGDALKDGEDIKDKLLSAAYGVWDYIKNGGEVDAANWQLDFVGFLPGKRETRRYEGDYILTQNDICGNTAFDDEVAYGGWPLDDHDPRGFETFDKPQLANALVDPYAIPYRCLYSKNVKNLFFAGRNISVSHIAMSSTRIMATCGLTGQAVGCAAVLAKQKRLTPAELVKHSETLKQMLSEDDCFLLNTRFKPSDALLSAKSNLTDGEFALLTDGTERNINGETHNICVGLGKAISIEFTGPVFAKSIRIVFDSDFKRETFPSEYIDEKYFPARSHTPVDAHKVFVPGTLVKSYDCYILTSDGRELLHGDNNNIKRLVKIAVNKSIKGMVFVAKKTWGNEKANIFSFDVITEK
jgi:hypothetical protein